MKNQKNVSPIHILVVSPFFYPHIGGSQRYIEELYVHMMRQQKNLRVTVLTYNTDQALEREYYHGLSIYRIPCWHILTGQFALPNLIALAAILIRFSSKHFDFVHTHIRFFDATWWAWAYAKMIGAKSIFTEHVATHPVHPNTIVRKIAKVVDMTIAKISIDHYDLVTTTNTPAKLFLETTLGIHHPVTLSYGGVDTSFFAPKQSGKKHIPHTSVKLSSRDTVITYAGRIIWSKGIMTFVKAIKTMKTMPHVHFVFAGTGDLLPWLKNTIHREGLTEKVSITGPLTPKEVRSLFDSTDIFIHPSHHNEGFPNVLLEAAASGCVVVTTNNAGTYEMFQDKKTAYFIPMKNDRAITKAVQEIRKNPSKTHMMTKAARLDIQNRFDWQIIARQFFHLLKHTSQTAPKPTWYPTYGIVS